MRMCDVGSGRENPFLYEYALSRRSRLCDSRPVRSLTPVSRAVSRVAVQRPRQALPLRLSAWLGRPPGGGGAAGRPSGPRTGGEGERGPRTHSLTGASLDRESARDRQSWPGGHRSTSRDMDRRVIRLAFRQLRLGLSPGRAHTFTRVSMATARLMSRSLQTWCGSPCQGRGM